MEQKYPRKRKTKRTRYQAILAMEGLMKRAAEGLRIHCMTWVDLLLLMAVAALHGAILLLLFVVGLAVRMELVSSNNIHASRYRYEY